MTTQQFDTIIIGAGAAGMMCGAVAGARGRSVLIIDHAKKPGEKIRISGGGRCNFTNIHCGPENFISNNPYFCVSALARYTPQDFIQLVDSYGITWHEKEKGQLFCDEKAQQIVDMLLKECRDNGNKVWMGTSVDTLKKSGKKYTIETKRGAVISDKLVIACGGASIPKMGASRFGYHVAEQFGINVIEPVPALVPLTFTDDLKEPLKTLTGVSVDARVTCGDTAFHDPILFTHRGLSGPGILQISSYWKPGQSITVNMNPDGDDLLEEMKSHRQSNPKQSPKGFLTRYLPQRVAEFVAQSKPHPHLGDMSDKILTALTEAVTDWTVKPAGTEGFRTAEVTLGGVDTKRLSSKTMESRGTKGLYFIGEVVDVTGHLGGHNFQWAWASGAACGKAL